MYHDVVLSIPGEMQTFVAVPTPLGNLSQPFKTVTLPSSHAVVGRSGRVGKNLSVLTNKETDVKGEMGLRQSRVPEGKDQAQNLEP